MNEDEAQRLRERIVHEQTACRCGHLLAACADCRDWLLENSPRIQIAWEWWYIKTLELGQELGTLWGADAAEADALTYWQAGR